MHASEVQSLASVGRLAEDDIQTQNTTGAVAIGVAIAAAVLVGIVFVLMQKKSRRLATSNSLGATVEL